MCMYIYRVWTIPRRLRNTLRYHCHTHLRVYVGTCAVWLGTYTYIVWRNSLGYTAFWIIKQMYIWTCIYKKYTYSKECVGYFLYTLCVYVPTHTSHYAASWTVTATPNWVYVYANVNMHVGTYIHVKISCVGNFWAPTQYSSAQLSTQYSSLSLPRSPACIREHAWVDVYVYYTYSVIRNTRCIYIIHIYILCYIYIVIRSTRCPREGSSVYILIYIYVETCT